MIYLAVFIILSPAFDLQFTQSPKPHALVKEVAYALQHFYSLLYLFSERSIIFLAGGVVVASYVLDQMLGEFSGASVVFAQAVFKSQHKVDENNGRDDDNGNDGNDDNGDDHGDGPSNFAGQIEVALGQSHPQVIPYYSHCLELSHKDFLWSGPKIQILPHTEVFTAIILLTTAGELLDLPGHEIYDPATLAARTPSLAPHLASPLPSAPIPASSTQLPSEALAIVRTKRHG